ncbi:ribonuclease H-like domain-containing protein, partial [Tanacetum coccineum]
RTTSGLFLSQSKFAEEILERAHMHHCNPCRNLVDTESKLGPDGDPVCDPTMFVAWQRIIRYVRGTLDHGLQLHLSTTTQLTKYTDADWAVRVLHVPSEFQYVDIFTKGLPSALFLEFCSSLNVQRPPVLREYFPNYY